MNGKRKRLLLIEDDRDDQVALKQAIEKEKSPYSYSLVESVSEAREILTSKKYDLIVTNYLLGDGTGFDIFDLVSNIPIIAVTGSGNEGISDTGYGIPDEDVDKIFKPFFSSKEKGFGMGLPLVKQIVSEHLGELMVKSGPESGATFKMSFPARWNEDKLY